MEEFDNLKSKFSTSSWGWDTHPLAEPLNGLNQGSKELMNEHKLKPEPQLSALDELRRERESRQQVSLNLDDK